MTTECIEWQKARTRAGYGVVAVGRLTKYVHRLEMEKHLGRQLSSQEIVLHSCDNPACYNIEHLGVGSQADNVADAVAKGRIARGNGLPQTRFSDGDIAEMREMSAQGISQIDIARRFGAHQSYVSQVIAGNRRVA